MITVKFSVIKVILYSSKYLQICYIWHLCEVKYSGLTLVYQAL